MCCLEVKVVICILPSTKESSWGNNGVPFFAHVHAEASEGLISMHKPHE